MSMASTQLQVLRESLGEIFSNITITNRGQMMLKTETGEINFGIILCH